MKILSLKNFWLTALLLPAQPWAADTVTSNYHRWWTVIASSAARATTPLVVETAFHASDATLSPGTIAHLIAFKTARFVIALTSLRPWTVVLTIAAIFLSGSVGCWFPLPWERWLEKHPVSESTKD